ncbi:MAG TPA: hypothetical protein VNO30_20115 [Kofleriaceae bacterium]|nr:hypothetical protein [Kofleriaceae bacterium]
MGKWLAALGVVILVVLVLLWREIGSSDSTAVAAPTKPAVPVAVASAAGPAPTPAAAAPAAEPAADPSTEKMDPQSDEFFHHHDEIVIPKMMRQAVKCWENLPKAKRAEFHRNQSMVAKFKQRIRNGVVTIYDLEVERSTIKDPALEACFVQQLRSTTWSNPRLPDWDQDDQIKLGPRTLKKYTRENIEYVGNEDAAVDESAISNP